MRLITLAILASGFAPGLLAFNASKRESDTCTNNGIAGEMVIQSTRFFHKRKSSN